jgi:hypothetical protein
MRVFTTIFLAHPLIANTQRVDQANGLDEDWHGLAEAEQAPRERITMLESSNWFVDDGFDEE